MLGLGVVVAAFLSAPTFAVWILAFLNAMPAAKGGMEKEMTRRLRGGANPGVEF